MSSSRNKKKVAATEPEEAEPDEGGEQAANGEEEEEDGEEEESEEGEEEGYEDGGEEDDNEDEEEDDDGDDGRTDREEGEHYGGEEGMREERGEDRGEERDADEEHQGHEEAEEAEEQEEEVLRDGGEAHHDFLGAVKVLQLRHNPEHPWNACKSLVELLSTPMAGQGMMKNKGKRAAVTRWVFTDALSSKKATAAVPDAAAAAWSIRETQAQHSTGLLDEDVEAILGARTHHPDGRRVVIPAAVAQAHIHRKRKTKRLQEASKRGRRPKMGQRVTKEPKVEPAQRIADFPDNSLRIDNGALFCECCKIAISLRKGTIRAHCKGKMHKGHLTSWMQATEHQKETISLLEAHRKLHPDERGGCIAPHVQEFRFATVRTLMGCGIALNKLDMGLAQLISRSGMLVTRASDMAGYIEPVRDAELRLLREELEGQTVSVIFDGTTRVGEVLAVVVRYCTKDFSIEQRCIALTTAAKHMSGSELGGMLIRLLVKRIGPSALDRDFPALVF